MAAKKSITERFFEKIERIPEAGCWIWMGALLSGGYGAFKMVNPTRQARAHVCSWELHNGAVPNGVCVLHQCDVPACVNPAHLFLGTNQDNSDDKFSKNRQRFHKGREHHSAKLSEENVRDLRRLWTEGLTITQLGERFHITPQHAWNIANKKRWAHL